jgi:hypothetical protein
MSLPEFYLIHPNGCSTAPKINYNGLPCESSRGRIFNHNISMSYVPKTVYDFSTNAVFHNYGFKQVFGQVGWDSFQLNRPKESSNNGNKLDHLTIAEISTWNFTLMYLRLMPTELISIELKPPKLILIRFQLIPAPLASSIRARLWHLKIPQLKQRWRKLAIVGHGASDQAIR